MKKTVWTFGLISGAIAILMLFAVIPFLTAKNHRMADVVGYASMVLSALFVFFGVRSYRETAGAGRMTFGRGLAVGVLITLVSCVCSVVAFQIIYFQLVPDFGDKFTVCMIDKSRSSGDSPQEVEKVAEKARTLKGLFDNPISNAALNFATTFPIGLIVSAVSAGILKRR